MSIADPDIIRISNLRFKYDKSDSFELHIHDLRIRKLDQVFLEGPSGSGKSTFLNLITGLTKPDTGHINVLSTAINSLPAKVCDHFRADHYGIIFHLFNIIPYLYVLENVMLPCVFSKKRKVDVLSRSRNLVSEANRLCEELDIDTTIRYKPVNQLSIGQQQRVAIARALIGRPEIIIADEPTSALDNRRKTQFLELLFDECKKYGSTLVFVSHDQSLRPLFKTNISLNPTEKRKQPEQELCPSFA